MKNEFLVPDLIKDLVTKYRNAKMVNEIMSLEDRLRAIRDYLDIELSKKSKSTNNYSNGNGPYYFK